jgi:hypothetical protein
VSQLLEFFGRISSSSALLLVVGSGWMHGACAAHDHGVGWHIRLLPAPVVAMSLPSEVVRAPAPPVAAAATAPRAAGSSDSAGTDTPQRGSSSPSDSAAGRRAPRKIRAVKKTTTTEQRGCRHQEQPRAHAEGARPKENWRVEESEESEEEEEDEEEEDESEEDSPAGEPDHSCSVCGQDQDQIVIECRDCGTRVHPTCKRM